MLSEFEKKIADYVKANELVGPGQRLLLAVSGGADSTALLHVMHALKTAGALNCELLCAHLNHQLRATDADMDEEFVAAGAAELKLPLTTERLEVREYALREKLSTETAARDLRIQALCRIAKNRDCDAVATGHQKNDNAETVVQRLVRGTGFRGLRGIRPARVFSDGTRFISPLLCVGRNEITAYLQTRKLQWRRDRTNADCSYRRNFIRHKLLPELQRNAGHSIVEQLSRLAESAGRFYRSVCARADDLWPELANCADDEVVLDVELFVPEPPPVKVELIRRSLAQIGCGERDMTHQHYRGILELAERNVTARELELPGGFAVYREYGRLVFDSRKKQLLGRPIRLRSEQVPPCDGGSLVLNVPGRTRFGGYDIEATILDAGEIRLERFVTDKDDRVERFDLEKIELPLTVRYRRAGDRFVPLGMTWPKKLGKFLTDLRVPRRLRKMILVVADANKIIWVCPLRISDNPKITGETRNVLQLQITGVSDHRNSIDITQTG